MVISAINFLLLLVTKAGELLWSYRVLRAYVRKRKSSNKPEAKRNQEMQSTVFSCPFCNHKINVECRM
jgi:hypothetical protein